MEDRFRQVAEDPLPAAGAHHEDHADAGEADGDTDHDVRDENPRRLGAEHDGTGREEQRHEHDEVDEPLGDDGAECLAHRDVELLLGEIAAIDVTHLRRHHAVDEERRDHDADQRPGRTILAGVLEEHVPADRAHHERRVVDRERRQIEEGIRVADVVPGRAPVDRRAPHCHADDDDGDGEGRDRFGGEEAARQRRGSLADLGLATHQRGGHSADPSTGSETVQRCRQMCDRSEIRPNPAGVAFATAAAVGSARCRLRRSSAHAPRARGRAGRAPRARPARLPAGCPTDGSGRRP